jgi:hypothetical protein
LRICLRVTTYQSNDLSKNAQDSATLLASKVYYFLENNLRICLGVTTAGYLKLQIS